MSEQLKLKLQQASNIADCKPLDHVPPHQEEKGNIVLLTKHKSTLDDDGRARLAKAKKFAGTDLKEIDNAVQKALVGIQFGARYHYLFNELKRRVRKSIRDQQKAETHAGETAKVIITRVMRRDAALHEMQLMAGIPEDDR